jgi:hypothetical protein
VLRELVVAECPVSDEVKLPNLAIARFTRDILSASGRGERGERRNDENDERTAGEPHD